ncbi:G-protein coupled receptor isoform X2 [Musca autumnalis]|uniref:G-protein coupled receptor isoform X2 n=1 Tax=Musca autumnalis TaxID=221902 RepID=UPI003CE71C8A
MMTNIESSTFSVINFRQLSVILDNATETAIMSTTASHQKNSAHIPNTEINNNNSTHQQISPPSNHSLLGEDNEVLLTIEYIYYVVSFYYVPIIVGTGSIGNILSVVVFFKTKLCKLSSSFYLAALAVSDTCFLFGLFAQWLNLVDVHIYNREYFCQFFTFFSNLACFCSVWFVVAFTVERFIAVMYPLKRQTMCTVRRAKMVLLGLTLLGCLHCAPFWISSTPVYSPNLKMTICDIKNEYKDYITLLNYWDTVVVFAVPFTTIAVLNTFTGCTVWKFATVRRTLTMQKKSNQLAAMHDMTVSTPGTTATTGKAPTCAVTVNTTTTTIASVTATASTPASTPAITCKTPTGFVTSGSSEQTSDIKTTSTTTYRLTSSRTSVKRQKLNSCTATSSGVHMNGHEHNHVNDMSHPHRGYQQHCSIKIKQHHHHSQKQQQHQQGKHHHHAQLSSHISTDSIKRGKGIYSFSSKKSGRRNATNSSQLKVTKMLLIVSTVFVCLNLPSCIMRMITYIETQTATNEKTTVVLQYIFQLLFVTNFGINFVLYCVSGQNFSFRILSQ